MADKNKNMRKEAEARYMELFYMTPSIVRAGDLAGLLRAEKGVKTELWDEMNVLELELSSRNTVDFEPAAADFKEPSDAAFLKNRGIRTIFAVSLNEADYPAVKPYFEEIVKKFSGFFCADTADFNPVYVGTAVKKV